MSLERRWLLILGSRLIASAIGAAAANSHPATQVDASPVVTIHVHNHAQVDRKTLIEAETVGNTIFQKVGVDVRWIDSWDDQHQGLTEDAPPDLTHLSLNIVSQAVSNQLGNEVMGLAPGGGRDRTIFYVIFNRSRVLNGTQAMTWADRMYMLTPRTLGYVIAHEIGHLLLDMEAHSERGIMRGQWSHQDLHDIVWGRLAFTPEQAEALRTELARRIGRHATLRIT